MNMALNKQRNISISIRDIIKSKLIDCYVNANRAVVEFNQLPARLLADTAARKRPGSMWKADGKLMESRQNADQSLITGCDEP